MKSILSIMTGLVKSGNGLVEEVERKREREGDGGEEGKGGRMRVVGDG